MMEAGKATIKKFYCVVCGEYQFEASFLDYGGKTFCSRCLPSIAAFVVTYKRSRDIIRRTRFRVSKHFIPGATIFGGTLEEAKKLVEELRNEKSYSINHWGNLD